LTTDQGSDGHTDEHTDRTRPSMLDQMGGPAGFLYSTIPVIVFVTANAFLSLPLTIGISVATGAALFAFRLVRGEKISSAMGSLIGVAVAAGVVAWTGDARDFFVIGIWASLAGFVVTVGSLLARRPLTGVIWNAVHGGKHPWRENRVVLRAHDLATLAAVVVFGSRFAIQQWLYVAEETGGLGVARVVMGTPLTILAALVVVWAFRRSSKTLLR
jgi:hypothetical protein